MRKSLLKDKTIKKIIDDNCSVRNKKPQYGEQQAYLPHEIEGMIAVIPYPQSKPCIDDETGDKFKKCNDQGTEGHQQNAGMALFPCPIQMINNDKTDAA